MNSHEAEREGYDMAVQLTLSVLLRQEHKTIEYHCPHIGLSSTANLV